MAFATALRSSILIIAILNVVSFQLSEPCQKPGREVQVDRRDFAKNIVSGLGIASLVSASSLSSPLPALAAEDSLVDVYYGVGRFLVTFLFEFVLCRSLIR